MAKLGEIGETHWREAALPPPGREGREVTVGEREHHEIGRILAKVSRDRGLLKPAALAKDDMHQIPSPALMAPSFISPCSPISTSFDWRGRDPQGVSY